MANAGAFLSSQSASSALAERMLTRVTRDGAQVLVWFGAPLELAQVATGTRRHAKRAFVERADLARCGGQIPSGFAQLYRAFENDQDRGPALVAMFIEMARRCDQLIEQLELAGASEPDIMRAAGVLRRSLPRAAIRDFKPRVRCIADFDRVRAIGYTSAGVPGRIAEVRRTGLIWRSHILRKADVIVSETSE